LLPYERSKNIAFRDDLRNDRNSRPDRWLRARELPVLAELKQLRIIFSANLKPLGFRKQGQRFRRTTDGNVTIIEFQRSATSDDSLIRFTLNVGVVSGRLFYANDPERDFKKVGASEAHMRERIGFFLQPPTDHWWALTADSDARVVADEVATLVVDAAVPHLNEYRTDASLLALWRTGRSPGLTEGQRQRLMALLASV
jgi:hypothetical protein